MKRLLTTILMVCISTQLNADFGPISVGPVMEASECVKNVGKRLRDMLIPDQERNEWDDFDIGCHKDGISFAWAPRRFWTTGDRLNVEIVDFDPQLCPSLDAFVADLQVHLNGSYCTGSVVTKVSDTEVLVDFKFLDFEAGEVRRCLILGNRILTLSYYYRPQGFSFGHHGAPDPLDNYTFESWEAKRSLWLPRLQAVQFDN